jgi:hypothetical protein
MKISISRSAILTAIVLAFLVIAVPDAIRRLIQTGDYYLFSRHFFSDMVARFSGPGRLRFIVQPTVAILLGARDSIKDARAGAPSFLRMLASRGQSRRESLKSAFISTRDIISIAILFDLISQYLIFHVIHPGAALLLGPVLIAIPYALSRAWASQIWWGRGRRDQLLAQPDIPPAKRVGLR